MRFLILIFCLFSLLCECELYATTTTTTTSTTTTTMPSPGPMIRVPTGQFSPLLPVTIADSMTTSSAIDLNGMTIVGMQMPVTMSSTAITFLAAITASGVYQPVYNGTGTLVSITVASGEYIQIDPTKFQGIRFLKLVMGSSESPAITVALSVKGL